MYRNKRISLVIPCFNEERGIREILKRKPLFIDEIIVVDNNSTDGTSKMAKKLGAQVVFEEQKGYGQAYLTGFKAVQGDIIITMDGDDSHSIEEVSKIINILLDENIDFISGSRFPLKYSQSMGITSKFGNFILTLFFSFLTLKKIRDSQSGMWVFRKRILSEMKLKSKGMAFSEEIKMEAVLNKNIKFQELQICFTKRIGEVKLKRWKDGLINLFFLFKKRLELFLR